MSPNIQLHRRARDKLPVTFHQVEDWHELIVSIVNDIKDALELARNI